MTMPASFVLWGATGQALVLAELLEEQGHTVAALIDRAIRLAPLPNCVMLKDVAELNGWLKNCVELPLGAVAIGGPNGADRRESGRQFNSLGIATPTLTHRMAFCAKSSVVGKGSQILANASVCAKAEIGAFVIVNTKASVDHGSQVGDGAHIGPGATVCGEVLIGQDVFIGAGAVVLPRVELGQGVVVGAGAIVTRSVLAGQTVVGNPARPIN